ncbi:MAG: aldehyde ferredoxin oxidoreductase N-terminal domain-containing protein [Dehalococcoidia bacterium]
MENYGYAGYMLRVDLSTGNMHTVPTIDYAGRFLGGRGIAAKIHWDEVPPEVGAFDEKNRLTIALGPMAGVPVIGASRWGVFGKSPLPASDRFCYCNLGGRWGAELKFSGYDGLTFQGRSDRPVYLVIDDGKTELKDASALWGKGTIETREILKQELGESFKIMAIGPAGENMVTTASLLAENDASGSGGLGGVMGSKNLKAVAVRGTKRKVGVAEPERLRELTTYFRELGRDNVPVWGVDFKVYGPNTKKDPCFGCLGNCIRTKYFAKNGESGKFMCQSRFFYLMWSLLYYGEENDVPFYATKLCDEYGLDTWNIQGILEWLDRCFQRGILTEQSTGIEWSKVGSIEFLESLVKMISLRRGFGDVLAQGLEKAAASVGPEAVGQIVHWDSYEPRMYITNALIFPFEPRQPIQQLHEVGITMAHWSSWVKGAEGAVLSTDALREIAKRYWGSEAAADLTSTEGKALAAKLIQDRQYTKESLMLCDYIYPFMWSNLEDHVGDPTFESKIYSAVTGNELNEEQLNRFGERVFNLQRAIHLREGRKGRQDDALPESWHTDPLEGHVLDADCIVPDKNGQIVTRKGAVIDRQEFERLKSELYELRGWDAETGLQTYEILEQMDLSEVAYDLQQRGLLGQ